MARWTDIATRQEHTVNQVAGGTRSHRGVVVHIAEGSFEGTIAWQKNPAAQISSHFIVDVDGSICQMVDTDDRAWCQAAGNDDWLSIENAGRSGTPLTDAQIEANARILARAQQVYRFPLQLAAGPTGLGLGHHSMGGAAWGGHYDCPGSPIVGQKPLILDRAQQIITGTDPDQPATTGDDMPQDCGDLAPGFAFDENGNWLDPNRALVVPLPAVGPASGGGWGPAWLYLASPHDVTVRHGSLISGAYHDWADAHPGLLAAAGPIGLTTGTTAVVLGRRKTSPGDTADAVPVRWRVQYGT